MWGSISDLNILPTNILPNQEFDFEIIVNPGSLNAGPNNLSRIETGEE